MQWYVRTHCTNLIILLIAYNSWDGFISHVYRVMPLLASCMPVIAWNNPGLKTQHIHIYVYVRTSGLHCVIHTSALGAQTWGVYDLRTFAVHSAYLHTSMQANALRFLSNACVCVAQFMHGHSSWLRCSSCCLLNGYLQFCTAVVACEPSYTCGSSHIGLLRVKNKVQRCSLECHTSVCVR